MPAHQVVNGQFESFGSEITAESTKGNVALGKEALAAAAAKGEGNVGIGEEAGKAISTGKFNVCLGSAAAGVITTGKYNVCVGSEAGGLITTGEANIVIGRGAGAAAEATGTIAIGNQAGGGANNIMVGFEAGRNVTEANEKNTLVGQKAGLAVTKENTALGYKAGEKVTGAANVLIGHEAAGSKEGISNKLVIANNATTAIIEGVMSATAASNELTLTPAGGKLALFGGTPKAQAAEIKVPGAFKTGASGFETEAEAKAIRDKLTTVIEALKNIGVCV